MNLKIPSFLRYVGPGMVTGAAEHDPPGIASAPRLTHRPGKMLAGYHFCNPQRKTNMSLFNSIKQSVTNAANSMNSELKKFRSKDLLQAIVAGSTMIAYADGVVTAEEKQKLLGFVRTSEQLSVFESDKVIEFFNQYLTRFDFDATIGAGEALQKISAFKGKPEAELIVRVCLAIAKADGNIDAKERQALGQICQSLGLDINNFS